MITTECPICAANDAEAAMDSGLLVFVCTCGADSESLSDEQQAALAQQVREAEASE